MLHNFSVSPAPTSSILRSSSILKHLSLLLLSTPALSLHTQNGGYSNLEQLLAELQSISDPVATLREACSLLGPSVDSTLSSPTPMRNALCCSKLLCSYLALAMYHVSASRYEMVRGVLFSCFLLARFQRKVSEHISANGWSSRPLSCDWLTSLSSPLPPAPPYFAFHLSPSRSWLSQCPQARICYCARLTNTRCYCAVFLPYIGSPCSSTNLRVPSILAVCT